MARPREFDETAVLDAAVQCFWNNGFEATSVRELAATMGINGASLYNAFGDKRSLYERALDHYVDTTVAERMARCEAMAPRDGIAAFFREVVERSLADPHHRGCLLVNAALDVAPHDDGFQRQVAAVMGRIEGFFGRLVAAGQRDGTIAATLPAAELARHLLGVLMGVRVLARVRPERSLLEGVVTPALTLLDCRGEAK